MIQEEPEFSTNIHDFTTLFYVILTRKSSEWLESSVEGVLVCDLQYGALT